MPEPPLMRAIRTQDIPEDIRSLPQPVTSLYVQGNAWPELMRRPRIAIVGSRNASPYGTRVTIRLVQELARAGVVIVSGLAIGVDSIAHRAALEANGSTIAVLPSSLDAIYPARHTNLAKDIYMKSGALVSEYPPGTRAQKWTFIARNRLVAGLSQAVLVTEAAAKSGTLHTAEFALEQGKDVLAVPGNITNPLSEGTNELIKQGAQVITNSQEILDCLGVVVNPQATARKGGTTQEQLVLDLLEEGPAGTTELQIRSKLDTAELNQVLTMLEIQGSIRTSAGAWLVM